MQSVTQPTIFLQISSDSKASMQSSILTAIRLTQSGS